MTAIQPDHDSALCLACGMCCTGVLHTKVSVEPAHLPLVTKLGLKIEEFDDHSIGFRQPCVLYVHDRCSVHPHRPPACKDYRCALLRMYQNGDVTLEEGLATVRDAKALLAAALDDKEPKRRPAVADDLRRELAQRDPDAALVLKAATLDVFLRRHFWPGRSR